MKRTQGNRIIETCTKGQFTFTTKKVWFCSLVQFKIWKFSGNILKQSLLFIVEVLQFLF